MLPRRVVVAVAGSWLVQFKIVLFRSYMSDMANTTTFVATGTIATFVVQATGTYYLSAEGAQGGSYPGAFTGGAGGFAGAGFYLTQGETLLVAVGVEGGYGYGSSNEVGYSPSSGPTDGGGGGGSFVVLAGSVDVPLLVAGGGGGGAPGAGGTGGAGGVSPPGDGQGASGAGFFGNGAGTLTLLGFYDGRGSTASGGQDFANGLAGGSGSTYDVDDRDNYTSISNGNGGFGGGGGAGNNGVGGGGATRAVTMVRVARPTCRRTPRTRC